VSSLGLAACQSPSDAASPPAAADDSAADDSAADDSAPDDSAAAAASLPDSVLVPPDSATARAFEEAMTFARAQDLHTEPLGVIMQTLGARYTGRPYLAGTLDEPPTERLVLRLDGFDCVTFVETMLALARTVKAQTYSYADVARHMADQRYRGGGPVGYCARLHYFTDWIADNAERGPLRRLDATLGGRVLRDTLDFMSTHRSAYNRFATNDSLYACVQQMESRVHTAQQERPVRYVPQDSIRAVYDRLRAGDIVAFATSIDGLDVSHTGLVYAHDDGQMGLLHASTSDGVVVLPDLQRYVQQIDHQMGIVVTRPTSAPAAQ
jgi:hypothetical protein